MKTTAVIVITADQIGSRRVGDRVPETLAALRELPRGTAPTRSFQRTAGDEIQGLYSDPTQAVTALVELTRLSRWRIGVGVGQAVEPIPRETRAASGSAFVNARDAVNAARGGAQDLAVRADGPEQLAQRAEAALWLLLAVLRRRTEAGWEVAALLTAGKSGKQAAATLGITESAVSQRASTAAWREEERGRALAADLLGEVLHAVGRHP